MAKVYTPLPKKEGELRLAKQLVNIPDDHLHLWFSVGHLANAREVDVLLVHEQVGVFCIEAKAVPLSMIHDLGKNHCVIQGRSSREAPWAQAYEATEGLFLYLRPEFQRLGQRAPFLNPTVCWPLISRAEWNAEWRDDWCARYAKSMLFREDLTGGPERLRERLAYIESHPLQRVPAKDRSQAPLREVIESLHQILYGSATRRRGPSDLERLRRLERQAENEAVRECPASGERSVLYTGHPGTGKTFRLLSIGVHHAYHGRRSLYACYNKTLAADIRRLLSLYDLLKVAPGSVRSRDVWDIIRRYIRDADLEMLYDLDDLDEIAELAVTHMEENREIHETLAVYDTILVDEAQDMKDWAFRMLTLLAKKDAVWCVAAGRGQELYGDQSSWLGEFATRAKSKQENTREYALRRNFRNTRPVFQLAQLAYEADLKLERITAVARRILAPRKSDGEPSASGFETIEFLRKQGIPPMIIRVDDPASSPWDNPSGPPPPGYDEYMSLEYKRVIDDELNQLQADDRRFDLMILVPAFKSLDRTWVINALAELNVPYIDYTNEEFRRDIAPPDCVRVCTYHSARGLEARRILLFGMATLPSLLKSSDAPPGNMAYVLLSRANYSCGIVLQGTVTNEVIRFLERGIELVTKATGG